MGSSDPVPAPLRGRSEVELRKPAGLTHFLRARVEGRDGELWARPLESQTSGAVRSMVGASHLMILPSDTTRLSKGEPVMLHPVSWQR